MKIPITQAEIDFEKWMNYRGFTCVRDDSRLAQFVQHFDYKVGKALVEFKGRKKIYKSDSAFCYDRLLVEWQAVHARDSVKGGVLQQDGERNRIGWVRGLADWIVFEELDGWLWVLRSELKDLVSAVDWKSFSRRGNYSENYKAFQRRRDFDIRDDLFCYVPRTDILALAGTRIVKLDTPEGDAVLYGLEETQCSHEGNASTPLNSDSLSLNAN